MYPKTKAIRQERREAALARTVIRTPREQLTRLDKMFGEGLGAKKERAKLNKRLAETP